MCIVSPRGNVSPVRMNLGIRPVSALVRPLLSRGALVGVILLAVLVLGHSVPARQDFVGESASITRLPGDDTVQLAPRPRHLAPRPPPTPTAPPPGTPPAGR